MNLQVKRVHQVPNMQLTGYKKDWEKDYTWLQPVHSIETSCVTGLLCSLCKRHKTKLNIIKALFGAKFRVFAYIEPTSSQFKSEA